MHPPILPKKWRPYEACRRTTSPIRELERQYQVVLPDSKWVRAALGFLREGVSSSASTPAPAPRADPFRDHPLPARRRFNRADRLLVDAGERAHLARPRSRHRARALRRRTGAQGGGGRSAGHEAWTTSRPASRTRWPSMIASGIPQQAPAPASPYGADPLGAGVGQTGYESGSYSTGGYQTPNDPYAAPYNNNQGGGAGAAATRAAADPGRRLRAAAGPARSGDPAAQRRACPAAAPVASGGYPQQQRPAASSRFERAADAAAAGWTVSAAGRPAGPSPAAAAAAAFRPLRGRSVPRRPAAASAGPRRPGPQPRPRTDGAQASIRAGRSKTGSR